MSNISFKEFILSRQNPVIFDKNGEFVYFPTNKAMQTTLVRNILSDRCIVYKNNKTKWLEKLNETDFDNIYKFGITRHPIFKFESAFNYLKKQPRLSKRMNIANTNINHYIKTVVINFEDPALLNPHFEKQYESFYFNDKLVVDDLFKMEIQDDIDKMYETIGIPKNTGHFNKTNYEKILDEESIHILERIYSKDVALYK
jgi:hypothetical protein